MYRVPAYITVTFIGDAIQVKVSEFNNLSNKKLANYLRSEGINTLPAEKDDPKACWMKWRNGKVNYQKNRIPDEDFDSFDNILIR